MDFVEIKASQPYEFVVAVFIRHALDTMVPRCEVELCRNNFLRHRDEQLAFVFIGETQTSKRMTYAELYDLVATLSRSLAEAGVGEWQFGLVGYMPNLIETVVCMLAATSLGGGCGHLVPQTSEQGRQSAAGQVEPKVIIYCHGYFYRGKVFDTLTRRGGGRNC